MHHKCSICGNGSDMRVPFIPNKREEVVCPHCQSNSRMRHMGLVLARRLANMDILNDAIRHIKQDIYLAEYLFGLWNILRKCKNIKYSTYNRGFISLNKKFSHQDLQNLTYKDDSFDVVITQDVMEHIKDETAAFQEIHRVLRPGGSHIFTIPIIHPDKPTYERKESDPKEYHALQYLVYREYGNDFMDRVSEFGFDMERLDSTEDDKRYGIYDSYIFIAKKR